MEKFRHHLSLLLNILIVAIALGLLMATFKFGLEVGHPAKSGGERSSAASPTRLDSSRSVD